MNALKKVRGIVLGCVLPIVVYLFFAILRPNVFFGSAGSTIYTVLVQSITTCILGWGMFTSMMVDSLDFSIAAEMILYEIVATIFYNLGGFWIMIVGTVGFAAVAGVIKAFIKELIGVKSMVLGLGITYILASVGEMFSTNRATIIGGEATVLAMPPYNFIILIVTGAIMWFLISKSKFGAHARAIGGNETIAKSAGINPRKVGFITSMISSLFACIASLFTLSRGAGVSPQTGLASLSTAFTALMCVFVAFFLAKQVNITVGIYIGAVSMSIITIGLVAIGFDSELTSTVTSAFLLILMTYNTVSGMRHKEQVRREVANARLNKETTE